MVGSCVYTKGGNGLYSYFYRPVMDRLTILSPHLFYTLLFFERCGATSGVVGEAEG